MSDQPGEVVGAGTGGDDGEGGGHHYDVGSSAWLRGVAVVVVAAVIGILLLPSATRAPLGVATAAQSSPSTTTPGARAPTPTTTTTTLPVVVPGAATIHVLVANGTTVTGLAAGVASYLRTRGYAILGAVNATTKVTASHVYAAAAEQAAAGTVVSVLGLAAADIQPPSAVAPVASAAGATVVVVAGPDLGRFAPSASSSAGSSTG